MQICVFHIWDCFREKGPNAYIIITSIMLALKCMANHLTDTPILSVSEAMCGGHFRLVEYEILKKTCVGSNYAGMQ